MFFARIYNSTKAVTSDNQGSQWRNVLSRSIVINSANAVAYRPSGKAYTFYNATSNWLPDADIADKFVELKDGGGVRTGWTYTTDSTGEVENYDVWHRRRLDMKPGITGLWQVSGRNRLTFDEMVRIDLFYIENWSLLLDLKIILLTLPAVLRGDGAK